MAHSRIVVEDPNQLTTTAARWIEKAIDTRIRRTGSCSLALSGGNTPRAIYARLALSPRIAWEKVHVYFGDERCVPPDDPSSNYRMASDALLASVRIPARQVHRIRGESPDREAAALEYHGLVPDQIDLILLGIGVDGHTASIFPGVESIWETTRRAVPTRSPLAPHDRISITPRVIEAADALLVIAAGADKASAVARALARDTDPVAVPAQLAARGTWILDGEAAALL